MQLSTQKTQTNFITIMIVSLIFYGNKVYGIVSVPLSLLPYSMANFKQKGCMVQRQEIPTSFGGQRENFSVRL